MMTATFCPLVRGIYCTTRCGGGRVLPAQSPPVCLAVGRPARRSSACSLPIHLAAGPRACPRAFRPYGFLPAFPSSPFSASTRECSTPSCLAVGRQGRPPSHDGVQPPLPQPRLLPPRSRRRHLPPSFPSPTPSSVSVRTGCGLRGWGRRWRLTPPSSGRPPARLMPATATGTSACVRCPA